MNYHRGDHNAWKTSQLKRDACIFVTACLVPDTATILTQDVVQRLGCSVILTALTGDYNRATMIPTWDC